MITTPFDDSLGVKCTTPMYFILAARTRLFHSYFIEPLPLLALPRIGVVVRASGTSSCLYFGIRPPGTGPPRAQQPSVTGRDKDASMAVEGLEGGLGHVSMDCLVRFGGGGIGAGDRLRIA